MSRKRIAIDIDDTLANHAEAFLEFSNSRGYTQGLGIEDYREHWGSELWGVDHEEVERRAGEFLTEEGITSFTIKKDARQVLEKLAAENDLFIVTARPRHLITHSRLWVDEHFGDIFDAVHFVHIWEPGNTTTKADICKEIGAEYLLDDLARHCNLAAEAGIKAVLFGDYAWNRSDDIHTNVTRCKDWSAVLAYFESI